LGGGHSERYAEITSEFVRLKVDVIVTTGPAVPAAKRATSVIERHDSTSTRRQRGRKPVARPFGRAFENLFAAHVTPLAWSLMGLIGTATAK
jgi:hypothetical protein